MTTVLPYGSWPSPLTAADVARGTRRLGFPALVDGEPWWVEERATEDGRSVLARRAADGTVVDVSPPGWSVRTRLHEYGGRSWVATPQGVVVARWADQRLWLLPAGGGEPRPLTPVGAGVEDRWAEPVPTRDGLLLAVRERHEGGGVRRAVVAVPLDGSAADDAAAVAVLADGHDFFAWPAPSPDGATLAYVAWDHPRMPWDGTVLCVRTWASDGGTGPERVLAGGPTESVLQPEWIAADTLMAVSDRSGWWNLEEVRLDGDRRALCARAEEFAGPTWVTGWTSYAPLPDGRLAVLHGRGTAGLGILDPGTGELADLAPDLVWRPGLHSDGIRAVGIAGSGAMPAAVVTVDLATGAVDVVRPGADDLPDPGLLPVPEPRTVTGPGGRDVHAYVYPPRQDGIAGPDGERPPYVAIVHGGPTAHTEPILALGIAYLTSRGIGVVEVNYGGSTGYGREYRERLRGQWGVVDVEDTVAAVRALAADGLADPDRLVIRGGSAGGWTTLAALVTSDAFAAGIAYFPVTDLVPFVETTHDFESRYIDGLVGPLPEALPLYRERSPLTHLDRLRTPLLLLQGDDDRVVPPEQPAAVARALAGSGIPHRYLVFAGEQHGFRRASSVITALEAELSFLGQVLGFEPPDVPRLTLES